jgi:DNA-binding NarL/FixJ family response regulator
MAYMRATRVIYVENDPALREILARLLGQEPGIEVVAAVGSANEALQLDSIRTVDAALIDYSLGQDSLNGLELGMALRAFNENIGILIYSQFDIQNFSKRVPVSMSHGWGFTTKSGSADISEIAQSLHSVAKGINISKQDEKVSKENKSERLVRYGKLSERQRATMQLAAQGLAPKAIAEKLGVSYDVARQELSRTYKILVPEPTDDQVLSVVAILEFISLRDELEASGDTFA